MATINGRKLRETVIIDQLTLSIYDDETLRIETSGCCEISLKDLNAELAILGGTHSHQRSSGAYGHDEDGVLHTAEVLGD